MASITQLGYLGLGVKDMRAWEGFATQTLGLQANGQGDDGSLFLRMDAYHHRIVLHPSAAEDLIYTGWEVSSRAELDEMEAQLQSAGVAVQRGSQEEADARRVAELLKFNDLDGLATEIFYGPLLEPQNPFRSPRSISGFETGTAGSMGLGHIVVNVKDVDESVRFYMDVLGMKLSDYIHRPGSPMTMNFLHCNPRHHSLAMNDGYMRQNGKVAPQRLNHVMLELKELDDVGTVIALCQKQDMAIGNIGRHSNDLMVSAYITSPSGFRVEYGWGARTVDDSTWQVQHYETGSIWGHQMGQPAQPATAAPQAASTRT